MARLLVSWFSLSLDGYGAGPRQSGEDPLGVGGEALYDWIVRTGTFKNGNGGETGIDDDFAARGTRGLSVRACGKHAPSAPLP